MHTKYRKFSEKHNIHKEYHPTGRNVLGNSFF